VRALARKTPIITIKLRPSFLPPIATCMLNSIGLIVRNAPRLQGRPRCGSRTVEGSLKFRLSSKLREFFPMITLFLNLT
jgi:hypothetical protein